MKKLAGIILIITSIILAVVGFQRHDDNEKDIEIGNLEISAEKQDSKPYILYGIGGACLIAGIALMVKGD